MKLPRQSVQLAGLALFVRQGSAPMMLVIDTMGGSSGGSSSGGITNPVRSDVVTDTGAVFNDPGSATIRSIAKNVNPINQPTSNNNITIHRVHVSYRRSDGKNTPGVDVPFAFDNAVAVTIPPESSAPVTFDLVRQDAKLESPLLDLRTKPIVLTIIADVTFYGTDAVGNDVTVVGSVTINFANFAGA
jgi:hypothetical protein